MPLRRFVPSLVIMLVWRAADAQVPAGPEFVVNTYTTSSQAAPSLAMDARGGLVAVWESSGQDGGQRGIFGQRFDSVGVRAGAEFQVSAATQPDQFAPDVAVDRAGGFVVVWAGPEIMVRRFDRSGAPRGGDLQVNTYTTGTQELPAVTSDDAGKLVVVWESSGQDGDGDGIFGRRYDASGTPLGGEFQVVAYVTGDQRRPDVAMTADGGFVVAFDSQGGSFEGVFARRFSPSGTPLGGEFALRFSAFRQYSPSVAALRPDGFVVAWTDFGVESGLGQEGISAKSFNGDGSLRNDVPVVNTYTTAAQQEPSVAADGAGGFVVTWQSFSQDGSLHGIFGQRFNAAGTRRGAEFAINAFTTGDQTDVAVSADAAGNFVAAWNSRGQDGSLAGVVARRFQGLVPVAIVVDPAGNGVLEAGELVDVEPSWHNTTTATQAFQGSMFLFTGPTPGSYVVQDATADYGSAPAGTVRTCRAAGNCYAVIVAAPTRPAVHWDGSVQEALTGAPAAQGLQKQWTLHLGDSFSDVPRANGFYRFVETLLHHGVTGGCGAGLYCPSAPTSREQMAVFVLIAREELDYSPPACGSTPTFADVPATNPFCPWIEELARRGVVGGCGGGNYCPASPVAREQMAVFVLRTLEPTLWPPPCGTPVYGDVPATSPFCRWVEELTRRNVVTGCGGGNYCPTADVTREQMGAFISVTFSLSLYGP